MKLHENQLGLIRLLCMVNIMNYEDCLKMLDTENTGDMLAMSYAFRPLTKNCYVSKNKYGVVTVLQKGRALFPDLEPLFSNATRGKARQRVLQVSKVCMWMEMRGVPISGELMDTEEPYFIPSACWRKLAKGILSTTRFAGVLVAYGMKLAVYDIGDGDMEWQIKAEASLYNWKYNHRDTQVTGMILICDDGKRNEIAKRIIRMTMWYRKTLLEDKYSQNDKPVRYSRSPIRLRAQYEHVYLTTPSLLPESLDWIYDEEYYIENGVEGGIRRDSPKGGDIEVGSNRYYLNPAFDILKLVYFFSAVKNDIEDADIPYMPRVQRILVVQPEDLDVARMYPDVNQWKEASILAYQAARHTEEAE